MNPPETPPLSARTYNPNEFWLRTLLRWYIGLTIRPAPTIMEIVEREKFLGGLLTACAAAALWMGLLASYRLLYLPASDFVGGVFVLGPILAGIFVVFSIAIAIALHMAAQLMRCPGTMDGTVASMLMANSVGVFTALAGLTYFLLTSLVFPGWKFITYNNANEWLAFVTLVWFILMAVIVVRKNYSASWWRTTIVMVCGLSLGVPVAALISVPLLAAFVFFNIILSL